MAKPNLTQWARKKYSAATTASAIRNSISSVIMARPAGKVTTGQQLGIAVVTSAGRPRRRCPGPTDTEFFARAGILDTKLGQGKKADPAQVAEIGFKAR